MRHASFLAACFAILPFPAVATAQQPASPSSGGQPEIVHFVRPVTAAVERAKAERRLLFLKPVYGGMDAEGATNYCRGQW